MTRYFLGVDIGNTKSHALIMDETGVARGLGVAGNGNHEIIGEAGFKAVLHRAVNAAIREAGILAHEVCAAGFGVAGYDWPEDLPLMQRVIDALALDCPYEVVNDAVIGLIAGAPSGWGVCVAAGTGSNCRGRAPDGREGRVTGEGSRLGEYGGGSDLVACGLQAVSRAWSRRGPETMLTRMFVEAVGAKDADDLLLGIAREKYRLAATHAPLVFEAAAAGDNIAEAIVQRMGRELGNLACGVIRQLELQDSAFDLVLSGNFYKGSPLVAEMLQAEVCNIAPRANFVYLNAPPVVGGVMLAMQQIKFDFLPLRDVMIANTTRLID